MCIGAVLLIFCLFFMFSTAPGLSFLICIFAGVGTAIYFACRSQKQEVAAKQFQDCIYAYIQEHKISLTTRRSNRQGDQMLGLDEKNNRLYFFRNNPAFDVRCLRYSDIANVMLISNTITTSQGAGDRALVGGVIAGPTGAIIGASTASQVTETQIKGVKIITTNPGMPSFEIMSDASFCQTVYDTIISAVTRYRRDEETKRLELQREQIKLAAAAEKNTISADGTVRRRTRMERYHSSNEN